MSALARAVFLRRGQLAFRHHALLTSLVLEVVRDYWTPPAAEPAGGELRPAPENGSDSEDTAPVMILAIRRRAGICPYTPVQSRPTLVFARPHL